MSDVSFSLDSLSKAINKRSNMTKCDKRWCEAHGVRFRMKDADGHVCDSGYFIGEHDGQDGFLPLDSVGAPDYGAVSIEYFINGRWQEL